MTDRPIYRQQPFFCLLNRSVRIDYVYISSLIAVPRQNNPGVACGFVSVDWLKHTGDVGL